MKRIIWIGALAGGLATTAGCGVGRADLIRSGDRGSESPISPPAAPPPADADDPRGPIGDTSYSPTTMDETFDERRARLVTEKPSVAARQQTELDARYDLADRPSAATMHRGKPVQGGVRVKLPTGLSWEQLSAVTPAEIKAYYTDGTMHDLKTERFFAPLTINDRYASRDGAIKTFVLRGIKDSPPYLHDGRLMTLDDTVEFFNLVLQLRLTAQEKRDLVSFMTAL